jgi:hypothetical protein
VSDEFLDPLMKLFHERIGTSQQLFKRDYHGLAEAVPLHEIDAEVVSKLDAIRAAADRAVRPEEAD